MSTEILIVIIGSGLALLGVVTFFAKRPKKELDRKYYEHKWRELQKLCSKSETWPMAIIRADNLLDEALRKSRYKGKTMGERLVSAQKSLSNNDGVWFAHKLRNKLVHEVEIAISEKEVKNALIGLRQALRDLGALK
jgi:hypothetical protein